MSNVIQSNDTLFATRQARTWGRFGARKRGFCTLLVVNALLCGLSGCGVATPGPSPAVLEPGNDAQPSLVATAPLTSTAPVTAPVAQTITITVTDPVPAPAHAVTDTQVITATPNEAIITYTVKADDVLGTIARQYGTTVEAIQDANGLTGTLILLGQILTIPQTIAPPPLPSATATPTAAATLTATPSTSAAAGSDPAEPPGWPPLRWITENAKMLAIYTSLLAMFLVAVLLARALGRGRSSLVPPPPASLVPSTSAGLAGPPAAGTAYLETRLVATGATLYYPLAQNVISIGRDPSNNIVLDQRFADLDGVSRQHAQIMRTGAVFVAKDLGSANGIWIDHRRSRENVLRDGATLGIGKTQFIFRLNPPRGTV